MFSKILTPRQQKEEALRMSKRLPPGQSLTQKFPILHHGSVPQVNLLAWTFRVFGEVEEAYVWNWQEFNQLPRTK